MTARRLPAPLDPTAARGPSVHFTFDGRSIEAPEGEPVAVALLAAGRPILSRSFRFHRPRGLMCATGRCGWCECEVDGRPSVRTCRVPVRAGLAVRGEHALPSVDRDLLGLVGLAARVIPPTFYHHRFLRPRWLRGAYLDVLRWFGGRGRLRTDGSSSAAALPGTAATMRPVRRLETDVLVVGAGPGGMTAAVGAAQAGASVVVVDARDVRPGGDPGVTLLAGTTVVGLYERVVLAISPDAQLEIRARSIVAATGSIERLPTVRGNDLPGVMGARTVVSLVRDHGVVPGRQAVLVGDDGDLAEARALLEAAGAAVHGTVPTADLARIDGRRGVSGVRTRTGTRLRADLVVIGDRTPTLDLALAAGAGVSWRAGRLVPRSLDGATAVPWLFLAGSAAGVGPTAGDPERHREAGRRAAGAAGAAGSAGSAGAAGSAGSTTDGSPASEAPPSCERWHRRALVCFCEDVHVGELVDEAAAADGEPELVKRRTGALTGPCQGAFCLGGVAACTARGAGAGAGTSASPAGAPTLTTARPPFRPTRLGDLAAVDPPERTTVDDPGPLP